MLLLFFLFFSLIFIHGILNQIIVQFYLYEFYRSEQFVQSIDYSHYFCSNNRNYVVR